jgi:acyl-CoA thioester hydrolase
MKSPVFEPPASAYLHRFCVQAADMDELGHANNVVWVRWLNEAAIAHATHVGLGWEACRRLGVAWVVRRHDLEYLLPAFAGEEIEAITWPETLRAATSLRRTMFVRQNKVLARGETTWVLLELRTGKPRRVPPEMLAGYGF